MATVPPPSVLDRIRWVAAAPFLAAATLMVVGYTLAVAAAEAVGGLAP